MKHFFHDHLRLERIKLKNPDTNDDERTVSTNVFKIENTVMKLKNADTNDHERNVSTNVLEIVLERQNTFHNQKEF